MNLTAAEDRQCNFVLVNFRSYLKIYDPTICGTAFDYFEHAFPQQKYLITKAVPQEKSEVAADIMYSVSFEAFENALEEQRAGRDMGDAGKKTVDVEKDEGETSASVSRGDQAGSPKFEGKNELERKLRAARWKNEKEEAELMKDPEYVVEKARIEALKKREEDRDRAILQSLKRKPGPKPKKRD